MEMIWFIILDFFIISAAVGGEKWLCKTVLKMIAFFTFLMIAREHTGAAVAMGIVILSAAGALMLLRVDQRKKRTLRRRPVDGACDMPLSNN